MIVRYVINMDTYQGNVLRGNFSAYTMETNYEISIEDQEEEEHCVNNVVVRNANSTKVYNMEWCMNSGTSSHMTFEEGLFSKSEHTLVSLG